MLLKIFGDIHEPEQLLRRNLPPASAKPIGDVVPVIGASVQPDADPVRAEISRAIISVGVRIDQRRLFVRCGGLDQQCNDAVAMMDAAEDLTLGDTWWESDPTAAGFVGPPTMFKVAAADRMIIETEAVDSMDTYLQLFSADGLKGDHNDDYNGLNSRLDLDNSRVRPSECIESWGDYEGMVCDADGTEREATCQRVVSESDLTAATDGVLLCIGPQYSSGLATVRSSARSMARPHDRSIIGLSTYP